ncbi:hypothetical protein ACFXKR_37120 [Streptomyces violascens]|uniref:hypothetical protein n=1 Tax=Streptomyces violascens TaxID=67381 RepID=UPI0036A59476
MGPAGRAQRWSFGSPRSQRAHALCAMLEQVVAQYTAPAAQQDGFDHLEAAAAR